MLSYIKGGMQAKGEYLGTARMRMGEGSTMWNSIL
jgi:hypothetical protein